MRKNFLISNSFLNNNKKIYWTKFISSLIFANLILVLIYSKIVLSNKIYIPSYYFFSQTFYNIAINKIENKVIFGFNIPLIIFYTSAFILNIPLFIFSYYKLGKRFTYKSIISVLIWFIIGLILSINAVDKWLQDIFRFDVLHGHKTNKEKVEVVGYYIVAIFSGICVGLGSSIIWKKQISGGGLDFIYTYFATKKKKEIHKISTLINFITVSFSILLNEYFLKTEDAIESLDVFVLLLIAALLFGYSYSWMLNYLYPKFKLVNLIIVTEKYEEIRSEIINNFNRSGNIINVKGLYEKKNKKIILTTLTYLEKIKLEKKIIKIDPNVFLMSNTLVDVKGNFKIKANDDD